MAAKELNSVDEMGMKSGGPSHSWSSNSSFNPKAHFGISLEMGFGGKKKRSILMAQIAAAAAGIRGWAYLQGKVRQGRCRGVGDHMGGGKHEWFGEEIEEKGGDPFDIMSGL